MKRNRTTTITTARIESDQLCLCALESTHSTVQQHQTHVVKSLLPNQRSAAVWVRKRNFFVLLFVSISFSKFLVVCQVEPEWESKQLERQAAEENSLDLGGVLNHTLAPTR